MEFHEKLQELRRQKGLTQEKLASQLFVSRAAVSKWESGRGYPGIDSLKAISKFFSISIDDLLSADELISLAEDDQHTKQLTGRTVVFGLMDCGSALLFLLPLFADRTGEAIRSVSLLFLSLPAYVKLPCLLLISLTILFGVLTLAFQNRLPSHSVQYHKWISLALNGCSVLLFILTLQPYAAVFALFLLSAKAILLLKRP